ncbi:hypothetical protein Bpfe_003803 [Biomphalaria pfeifferi]|uniref:Uncharacterized protein n=1 Tax=Biomphalaria pfeifferi TaxID=112525 RepID=A0AAD8FKA5_BIOPF|nr:hypothetical protein Bpfe_003803 [Biomphalaria pfeifferi]
MSSEKEKRLQDIISALKDLEDCDIEKEKCTKLCTNVLDTLYSACETKAKFTKEEIEQIGSGLDKNIHKILSVLLHFGYFFEPKEGPRALKYRSALQFILDKFGKIKVIDSSNSQNINLVQEITESDALKVLDEAILLWKKNITVGLDIEGFSVESLYKPDDIPKHHTWWIPKDSK